MASNRRTVHIPIVQPRAADPHAERHEDRLIEVYTQLSGFDALTREEQAKVEAVDIKARDKDWDQVAAPLRKVGLYAAGCAAASAVRKLGMEPPLGALYQRVSRLAWIEGQRLQAATPKGPSEGRSAELGLALVLLMCASGSRDRQVVATGALGGQPPGVAEDDVEILPVGSLPEKLRLLLTLAGHGSLPRFDSNRELLFFTPKRFEAEGDWQDVASLAEVDQLKSLGVRVVPIERLSEAAAVLDARRSRHLLPDRLAQAAVILLMLFAGAAGAWSMLPTKQVPLAFMPGGGTAMGTEPYQACFTSDGGFYPVPLGRDGIVRNLPAGATLGWRVQVGEPAEDSGFLDGWLQHRRYHVAQVMLSAHSPAKVILPASAEGRPVTVTPGEIWEWGWQMNDRPESNMFVLLAQPDEPFDGDKLRSELLDRFPAAAGSAPNSAGLDVSAAANFLTAAAPGSARFALQTVEGSARCNP